MHIDCGVLACPITLSRGCQLLIKGADLFAAGLAPRVLLIDRLARCIFRPAARRRRSGVGAANGRGGAADCAKPNP